MSIVTIRKIETIRIEAPKSQMSWDMGNVQRLNGNGHESLTRSMIAQDIV
jgi:hypothetical protein